VVRLYLPFAGTPARLGPAERLGFMSHGNRLAERFPLVGRGLSPVRFTTPRDADWLPPNWESRTYPKGKKGGDNTEAILQWFDWEISHYQEHLIPLLETPEVGPEDPGECDRGNPARDAYRLVEQLREGRKGGAAPPCEPRRGYVHYRDDLEGVVAELRKVRDWVAQAGKLEEAVTWADEPSEEQPKRLTLDS